MIPLGLSVGSPVECSIVRRLNRFVVEVEVDGTSQTACINNTGRLSDYLLPGQRGFCTRNRGTLKTSYRLFAIRDGELAAVIDTQLQMRAFEETIKSGYIPWLEGCSLARRNARLGNSLIDYLLDCRHSQKYLEVKSAVLRDGQYAMYPDSPTVRGRRHIRELTEWQAAGGASAIVFIAALPGAKSFKPDRRADPEMADLLLRARDSGVGLRAIGLHFDPGDGRIYLYSADLPVEI